MQLPWVRLFKGSWTKKSHLRSPRDSALFDKHSISRTLKELSALLMHLLALLTMPWTRCCNDLRYSTHCASMTWASLTTAPVLWVNKMWKKSANPYFWSGFQGNGANTSSEASLIGWKPVTLPAHCPIKAKRSVRAFCRDPLNSSFSESPILGAACALSPKFSIPAFLSHWLWHAELYCKMAWVSGTFCEMPTLCRCCFSVVFTDDMSDSERAAHVHNLVRLLSDLAIYCPLATNSVECLHGQHQTMLAKFRGKPKQAKAAGIMSLVHFLQREHAHLKARVNAKTLPSKFNFANMIKQLGWGKKGQPQAKNEIQRRQRAAMVKLRRLSGWNMFQREKMREVGKVSGEGYTGDLCANGVRRGTILAVHKRSATSWRRSTNNVAVRNWKHGHCHMARRKFTKLLKAPWSLQLIWRKLQVWWGIKFVICGFQWFVGRASVGQSKKTMWHGRKKNAMFSGFCFA